MTVALIPKKKESPTKDLVLSHPIVQLGRKLVYNLAMGFFACQFVASKGIISANYPDREGYLTTIQGLERGTLDRHVRVIELDQHFERMRTFRQVTLKILGTSDADGVDLPEWVTPEVINETDDMRKIKKAYANCSIYYEIGNCSELSMVALDFLDSHLDAVTALSLYELDGTGSKPLDEACHTCALIGPIDDWTSVIVDPWSKSNKVYPAAIRKLVIQNYCSFTPDGDPVLRPYRASCDKEDVISVPRASKLPPKETLK